MLSMLWQCCCRVVLKYFCNARAIDGNMACAASRGSISSPGGFFFSSSFNRLTCVNASSTATTSLKKTAWYTVKLLLLNLYHTTQLYTSHKLLLSLLPCLAFPDPSVMLSFFIVQLIVAGISLSGGSCYFSPRLSGCRITTST